MNSRFPVNFTRFCRVDFFAPDARRVRDALSGSAHPIGLHRVHVVELARGKIKVGPLEAIHGTPVVDIKPVLSVEVSKLSRHP